MKTIARTYVLTCLIAFIYSIGSEEQEVTPQETNPVPDYLCDCGWRNLVKWNNGAVMMKEI